MKIKRTAPQHPVLSRGVTEHAQSFGVIELLGSLASGDFLI